MDIGQMQKDVESFSKERGLDVATLEQRTIYLVTEIGEIAKEIIKISYNPGSDELEKVKENLGLEMYDAMWNICSLANKLDIDLEASFKKKAKQMETRVWD